MSWLARSIANTLTGGSDGEASDGESSNENLSGRSRGGDGEDHRPPAEPVTPTRGVKDDISELTQTLTRQFWGVASFLAPPPTQAQPDSSSSDHGSPSDSPRFAGIRSDFAEIGGKVRSGISMLSSHKAVSEISKIASTLFAPEEDDEEEEEEGRYEGRNDVGDVVGVTDEVLSFVRNVLMQKETWLDFPVLRDEDGSVEFHMSVAQQEHALAVERLAPQLATIRIELCPSQMSEGCFWKIYFVLLHPKLSKNDAEILTTPQIVQARAMLLQDVPNQAKSITEKDLPSKEVAVSLSTSGEIPTPPAIILDEATSSDEQRMEESTSSVPLTESKTDKHPIHIAEEKVIDKSVIVEEPSVHAKNMSSPGDFSNITIQKDEEDVDEWLQEETGEVSDTRGSISLQNEEDVSFSDLEDEDDEGINTSSKPQTLSTGSPIKEESDWVQLKKNSGGAARSGDSSSSQNRESNDWLDVDIDAV